LRIRRINRQTRQQQLALLRGGGGETLHFRPGRFRVDVVPGDRRNTAPVVDAGPQQQPKPIRRKVGRRLNVGLGAQQQASDRDGPGQVIQARFGRRRHRGARLTPEILDDEFLQVAVCVVLIAQGQQRLDTLAPSLANADQDARGKWNCRLAGGLDGRQTQFRRLVRRAMMGQAGLQQPG
jgi:hypothetical protein